MCLLITPFLIHGYCHCLLSHLILLVVDSHAIIQLCVHAGGMRDKTPTLEVNSADTTTLNPDVSAALREYLPRHFPQLRAHCVDNTGSVTAASTSAGDAPSSISVESEWIGIMGFTPDRNPLVGPLHSRAPVAADSPGVPHVSNEFIAAGYTGHGMPVAFLAGKGIADLICGVESEVPIPRAYHPSRFNL